MVPLGDFYVHNRISKEFLGASGEWKKISDIAFIFGVMKFAAYLSGMYVNQLFGNMMGFAVLSVTQELFTLLALYVTNAVTVSTSYSQLLGVVFLTMISSAASVYGMNEQLILDGREEQVDAEDLTPEDGSELETILLITRGEL